MFSIPYTRFWLVQKATLPDVPPFPPTPNVLVFFVFIPGNGRFLGRVERSKRKEEAGKKCETKSPVRAQWTLFSCLRWCGGHPEKKVKVQGKKFESQISPNNLMENHLYAEGRRTRNWNETSWPSHQPGCRQQRSLSVRRNEPFGSDSGARLQLLQSGWRFHCRNPPSNEIP